MPGRKFEGDFNGKLIGILGAWSSPHQLHLLADPERDRLLVVI